MPSPFPGMNPYLERPQFWADFHASFVPKLRALLVPQVRPRYSVHVHEHVSFREMPDGPWRGAGVPDVSVSDRHPGPTPPAGTGATATSPVTVRLPALVVEEYRSPYLKVVDRQRDEVVAVLELLSPANKYASADRDAYLVKRARFLDLGVNFVEIDLLRGGPRTAPGLPPCDYCAVVVRAAEAPTAHVWPWRLADPMPRVPVPLRPGEAEPTLDLKAALDAVYDEAGYEDDLYRHPPEPALTADQAGWAAGFLPAAAGAG